MFLAVAEEGSVTGAAQRLFLAQPALSKQLRALEHRLGVALIERLPRGVAHRGGPGAAGARADGAGGVGRRGRGGPGLLTSLIPAPDHQRGVRHADGAVANPATATGTGAAGRGP